MTDRLKSLYKSRPKDRLLRASVLALALLTLFTWSSGTITPGDFFTSRRLENLDRFLTEIVPLPLREGGFELGAEDVALVLARLHVVGHLHRGERGAAALGAAGARHGDGLLFRRKRIPLR